MTFGEMISEVEIFELTSSQFGSKGFKGQAETTHQRLKSLIDMEKSESEDNYMIGSDPKNTSNDHSKSKSADY